MLKAGTDTGSLVNHLYSNMTGAPEPVVGMGATLLGWTDRKAATIVAVEAIRGVQFITVQEDNAKRTDSNGMSESQDYDYTPNPDGYRQTFRKGAKGWEEVSKNAETGRWKKTGGKGISIGFRRAYHDYSF